MSYTFGRSSSGQNSIDNRNWPVAIVSNLLCTPISAPVRAVDEFYDHVGAHLRGVAKVLKPMLEMNNIIIDECRGCKSDDRNVRGKLNQCKTKLSYYTPQRSKYGSTTSSSNQRQCCKCDEDFSGKKLTSDNSYNHSTNKSTFEPLPGVSSGTTLSASKRENTCSKVSPSSSSSSSSSRLYSSTENKSSERKYEMKNCSMCGINIDKVKVLAVVPCKHLFCYACISYTELNVCPKCSKPLKREAIRNITTK